MTGVAGFEPTHDGIRIKRKLARSVRQVKKANYFFEVASAELTETDPIPSFFLPRLTTELVGGRKVRIIRHPSPDCTR